MECGFQQLQSQKVTSWLRFGQPVIVYTKYRLLRLGVSLVAQMSSSENLFQGFQLRLVRESLALWQSHDVKCLKSLACVGGPFRLFACEDSDPLSGYRCPLVTYLDSKKLRQARNDLTRLAWLGNTREDTPCKDASCEPQDLQL